MAAGEQSSPSDFQTLRLCLTRAAGSVEARETRLIVFTALGFSSTTSGNSASPQLAPAHIKRRGDWQTSSRTSFSQGCQVAAGAPSGAERRKARLGCSFLPIDQRAKRTPLEVRQIRRAGIIKEQSDSRGEGLLQSSKVG